MIADDARLMILRHEKLKATQLIVHVNKLKSSCCTADLISHNFLVCCIFDLSDAVLGNGGYDVVIAMCR